MSISVLFTVLKPVHREGPRFIGIFAVITLVLFFVAEPLGWIGVGLTVWCYYFFRDPDRMTPTREGLIVAPADGFVSQIAAAVPPAELGLGPTTMTRISIFMNVFDCHVNRAPVTGTITRVAYRPGKFVNASLDKASSDNERNALVIDLEDGRRLAVVQIAGLVARRIVCDVREGDRIRTGERFGMIRFGSRLDVYLPDGVSPLAVTGQYMTAGETVIADLLSSEPPRQGEIR